MKKGSNIYGIIFGASHPRAVDKFLTVAWKRNETNGEANFDIDEDAKKNQPNLFLGKTLTKIEVFKENVRKKVLAKEIVNNFQLFNYALEEGHLGKHASEVLREMKKNGEISFEGTSPLVTYEQVCKVKREVKYSILKK